MFKFENDLLKHHVRTEGWLPVCKNRLKHIRLKHTRKNSRRIRYFTFCAIGAIDVLMLDIAKVIRPSTGNRFDTIFFFERSKQDVYETQKRIPGAIGFPGDFVDIVLMPDSQENSLQSGYDPLESPFHESDEEYVRKNQIKLSQRHKFINSFPFDIINLDLEEFLFKPNDPIPGKIINSLRKILEWQRRPLRLKNRQDELLDSFSLMFTTQIGPDIAIKKVTKS